MQLHTEGQPEAERLVEGWTPSDEIWSSPKIKGKDPPSDAEYLKL